LQVFAALNLSAKAHLARVASDTRELWRSPAREKAAVIAFPLRTRTETIAFKNCASVRHQSKIVDACSDTRYTLCMMISFRHKGLEVLYRTGSARGIQAAHAPKVLRILAALDAASSPTELNQPSYKLHPLKGELKGYWSAWVNGNWRITFRFVGADVELVDYQDYH
jgi:proteic killer suppression protein